MWARCDLVVSAFFSIPKWIGQIGHFPIKLVSLEKVFVGFGLFDSSEHLLQIELSKWRAPIFCEVARVVTWYLPMRSKWLFCFKNSNFTRIWCRSPVRCQLFWKNLPNSNWTLKVVETHHVNGGMLVLYCLFTCRSRKISECPPSAHHSLWLYHFHLGPDELWMDVTGIFICFEFWTPSRITDSVFPNMKNEWTPSILRNAYSRKSKSIPIVP